MPHSTQLDKERIATSTPESEAGVLVVRNRCRRRRQTPFFVKALSKPSEAALATLIIASLEGALVIAMNCRVRRRSSIINLRPSDIALAILKLCVFLSTQGDLHSAIGGVLMPFLPVLPEEQASDEVKKIYEYVSRRWGFLPNYFQALARDRQLLEDQVNLYTNAMFDERGLPKVVKEQIATVVSGINMSSYCLPAHLEILGRMGMDKSLARRLSIDYKSATLDPKVVELLRFCDKLTNHPADMQRTDIENLRKVGWNDAAIFDAILITSLYACANRFSAGLGLTPDFE